MENAEGRITNDELGTRKRDEQVGKRRARRQRRRAGVVGGSDAAVRMDAAASTSKRKRVSRQVIVGSRLASSSLKGTEIIARGETLGKGGAVGLLPEGEQQLMQASVKAAPERAAFVARPAREWVAELEGKAVPGRLLDDLWIAGELAVCFGESGSGKSVLAVQAADAIASGVPLVIENKRFANEVDDVKRCGKPRTAEPRSVLYFDLKLTSLQFGRRYTMECDRRDTHFSDLKYDFPDGFIRCEFDPCLKVPEEYKTRAEWLLAEIEEQVRTTGAKIVVIDSLDRIATDGILRTREAAFLMSRLHVLKRELGLSILVLASITRRTDNAPLTSGRLLITRTISAFADSVFAIGRCRWDESVRYLKHLGSRSTDIVYDSEYLPALSLAPSEGTFLSFWFTGFKSEEKMLAPYLSKTRLDRSDEVKQELADGWTQRDISVRLGLSLGSVNRAANMWSPFDDRPKHSPTKTAKTVEQDLWPTDPDDDLLSWEDEEDDEKKITEDESKIAETVEQTSRDGHADTSEPPAGPSLDISLGIHSPHVVAYKKRWSQYDFDPTVKLDHNDIVCNAGHPMFGLKRRLDTNGREIFVAREHERSLKPKIWYRYTNIPGRLDRCENLYNDGNNGHHVTEVTHQYEPPPDVEP